MESERLRFLFGRHGIGADPRTEDERGELLRADRPALDNLRNALCSVIANQVLDNAPEQVWVAAQRMLETGLHRHEVLDQLIDALQPFVEAAVHDHASFDRAEYIAALASLPAPEFGAVLEEYLDVASEQVAVSVDELAELVAQRLGVDPDDPGFERLAGEVEEDLLSDPGAPIAMLPPDVIVYVPALAGDAVLTHRMSVAEHTEGFLELDVDLAGFGRLPDVHIADDVLQIDDGPDGRTSWSGPAGWLAELPLDALLAVRVGIDGEVTVTVLDDEPPAAPELVELLRAIYETELAEPGMPVAAEDLLLGMMHRDRAAFAQPRPPLSELAAAAGLELRGNRFAHDEWVWQQELDVARQFRLMGRLEPGPLSRQAVEAVALIEEEADDPKSLRAALDLLEDPRVLEAVIDELLGAVDDPDRLAHVVDTADRLVAAAGRSPRAAVARLIAAVAAERDARVVDAEAHLRAAAHHAPGWPLVEERLAWYASDRGDAAAALARWRSVGAPPADPDVAVLRPFAAGPATHDIGRNQPCWCGSGRKFKQCHLGRHAHAPLPERIGWLCRKAASYLLRRGGRPDQDVQEHAAHFEGFDDAADQVVLDVVLHEGGWFERFLTERGPLLPADEALLGASWVLVARTVYEVLDTEPGVGVRVRDLRTGDEIDVAEATFSRSARAGWLICARAVPDGAGRQFIGAIQPVRPGRERELLEVLDRGDSHEIVAWAAAAARPLTVVGAGGAALVDCTAVLRVSGKAAAVLDERYGAQPDGWTVSEPDGRVRGFLRLDGDELIVQTLTTPRMDALLDELGALLPGSEVVWQDRQPVDVDQAVSTARDVADRAEPVPLDAALIAEIQDVQERTWCVEPVPALDDLTPMEAVADPTRRAGVERLIAGFPELDASTGMFGLRPDRLRALLGL